MSLKCLGKPDNFLVQKHFQHAVINTVQAEGVVKVALLAPVVILVSQQVSSG